MESTIKEYSTYAVANFNIRVPADDFADKEEFEDWLFTSTGKKEIEKQIPSKIQGVLSHGYINSWEGLEIEEVVDTELLEHRVSSYDTHPEV